MPRTILVQGGIATPVTGVTKTPFTRHAGDVCLATAECLRQRRSPSYLQATQCVDATATAGEGAERILAAIAQDFPALSLDQLPLGIVACCRLGDPYEVHICDLGQRICQHYRRGEAMPPVFERARGLARHTAYAFIEIYHDRLRAIAADGTVSTVEA